MWLTVASAKSGCRAVTDEESVVGYGAEVVVPWYAYHAHTPPEQAAYDVVLYAAVDQYDGLGFGGILESEGYGFGVDAVVDGGCCARCERNEVFGVGIIKIDIVAAVFDAYFAEH